MNAPLTVRSGLTAERAHELLIYDPETGALNWRVTRPGCVAGALAGTRHSDGYSQVQIDFVFYKAHRVIWLMKTGTWPVQVDHRNGLRADNRWENLRNATPLENARNRAKSAQNKSGHVGVYQTRGKWLSSIGVGNRTVRLGCFEVKEDAIAARCEAERHYFGEFAQSARANR